MNKESELFRRFKEVIPGKRSYLNTLLSLDADFYFENLSLSGMEEIRRCSQDSPLFLYFELIPFFSIDENEKNLIKFEKFMQGEGDNKSSNYWFVRRKSDHYLVGATSLTNLNYARRSVEFSYCVDLVICDTGLMLQIQEVLKQYVFEILELNRLYGVTMIGNKRMISSLLSSGMQHEGVARQYYLKDGIFVDGWIYSMLSSDYFESIKINCLPSKSKLKW